MIKKSAYLFPILFLVYGFLISNDIYVPSRGSTSGTKMIIFGMLLLFLYLLYDYFAKNHPNKIGLTQEYIDNIKEEENSKKTILDYIAVIFYVFGIIYIILDLSGIVKNDLLFIIFVLSFGLFGSRIRKFF